jgi:hypothetical protein
LFADLAHSSLAHQTTITFAGLTFVELIPFEGGIEDETDVLSTVNTIITA